MNHKLSKKIHFLGNRHSTLRRLIREVVLPTFILSIFYLQLSAKSYPFDMNHPYEVQIVRVAEQGTKFLKVFGIAGSVEKAIDRAMQDAVAACIFAGVPGNDISGRIAPLCESIEIYESNKQYFDTFFKKGEFLNYVKNVNSGFPSGENNVSTSKGRKVGLFVQVMYDNLRKKLEQDGIIKSLDSYF